MSFKRTVIVLTLGLIIAVFWGCGRLGSNVVARIGDWTLTTDEFREIATKRWGNPENAARKSQDDLEELLDEVVVNRLKVIDGYNKGLDNDPDVQTEYQKALDRSAIQKLYRMEIRDKLISEDDIRNFYARDSEEIHASHILLIVREGEDDTEEKKKIDSIWKEATAPDADFGELAGKYSEDKSTPDGDLNWFQWGIMVEQFQEAAFALQPGEISEPIRTNYGWHIIKLHERREREGLEPFEEARERIIGQMARQRQSQLAETAKQYIENIKTERSYAYLEENANAVIKALEGKSESQDQLSLLTEEQQKLAIITMDNGEFELSIKKILERAKKLGPSGKVTSSEDQLHTFADRLLIEDFILPEQGRKLGCYDDPEIAKSATETRDRKIRQLAQKMTVAEKSQPTPEKVEEYFNAHPDSFMTDAQCTIREILVSDENKANELVERIKNGENMKDLAITYSERRKAKEKEGLLGPIRKTQYGEIGRMAAKTEIGKIVGPLYLKATKKWSIFKVIAKEDPKSQEFRKVKNKVESKLRMNMRKELEQVWVSEIKRSIRYKVNTAPLKHLYDDVKVAEEKAAKEKPEKIVLEKDKNN